MLFSGYTQNINRLFHCSQTIVSVYLTLFVLPYLFLLLVCLATQTTPNRFSMSNTFATISEDCVANQQNNTSVVAGGGIQELWNNIVNDLAMKAALDGNGQISSEMNGNNTVSSGMCILRILIKVKIFYLCLF